jgi:hypothetical protein
MKGVLNYDHLKLYLIVEQHNILMCGTISTTLEYVSSMYGRQAFPWTTKKERNMIVFQEKTHKSIRLLDSIIILQPSTGVK